MWFEERSWSNLKLDGDLAEEWRDLWVYKVDFTVAAMSYVWATTNFLNLPRLILENGGLAFVSAYGAALLACCVPVILMELSVGQLTGRAPILAFYNLSPIFKGVGASQVLFSSVLLVCMTRYLGWLLLFLYHIGWSVSLGKPSVPWLSCKHYPEIVHQPCREAGSLANFTLDVHTKMSTLRTESSLVQFMNSVEHSSSSLAHIGDLQILPMIAYAVIWVVVFCAICFGVRWMGKMVTLFFIIGISVFTAVLIWSLTLGGLIESIEFFYSKTDWEILMDYKVWKLAAEQALLATGCGFGAYITMASYCQRSNNVVCNTLVIVLSHALFSIMQVAVLIGLVGFVALRTGLTPLELIDRGETQMWHILSYVSHLQYIKIWSSLLLVACALLLFCVLFVLSLSLLSAAEDACGEKCSRCLPRFLMAFLICASLCAASFIFATQAGKHAYDLAVGSLKYVTLWLILGMELLAIAYFYCAHRLGMDLHSMLRPACCWCLGHFILFFTYLLPVIPWGIAFLNGRDFVFDSFSENVRSWEWWKLAAAVVAFGPLVPIPLFALCAILRVCCCGRKEDGTALHQLFGTRLHRVAAELKYTTVQQPNSRNYMEGTMSASSTVPRYATGGPGYLRLPQAPLAEPEAYNEMR